MGKDPKDYPHANSLLELKAYNFEDYLKLIAPKEMKEFADAPWRYKVRSPLSLKDFASISVRLECGVSGCEKIIDIWIDLYNNRSSVVICRRDDEEGQKDENT